MDEEYAYLCDKKRIMNNINKPNTQMGDVKMVSVIMPIFNAGIFLKDAISDILNQSYSDFELICIDDGSTDESGEILEYFKKKDSRVRIITQVNSGAGNARNKGIEKAKGEYILFLDADDRFNNTLLSQSLKCIKETQADIVIFDAGCFESSTCLEMDSSWILKKEYIPVNKCFNYKDVANVFFNITTSGAWNKLFRLDFVKSNNLFFMNTPYMNDAFFVLMALAIAEKIAVCQEKLVFYRQKNSNSITSIERRKKNLYCPLLVLETIQDALKKNNIYDALWKSYANYALPHIFWNEDVLGLEEYGYYFDKVKDQYLDLFKIKCLKQDEILDQVYRRKVNYLEMYGVKGLLYANCLHKNEMIETLYYENKDLRESKKSAQYCFWIPGIKEGSKIAIYGAGYRGKKIYDLVSKTQKYEVVQWVDKNYKIINSENGSVISPEKLNHELFDYIVIAIDAVDVVEKISGFLEKKIPKEKIIW